MLVGLNVSSRINCEAWILTSFPFPLLELELAMLLIVIRVVAIWRRSNLIIGLTAITIAIHSGVSLHLLSGIKAFWDPGPDYKGCVVYAPRMHLLSMSIATIATYAVLLAAMLAGLIHPRQARSFGMLKVLCQQGWVWFALAVAAEVPTLTRPTESQSVTELIISSSKSGHCICRHDNDVPDTPQLFWATKGLGGRIAGQYPST